MCYSIFLHELLLAEFNVKTVLCGSCCTCSMPPQGGGVSSLYLPAMETRHRQRHHFLELTLLLLLTSEAQLEGRNSAPLCVVFSVCAEEQRGAGCEKTFL